MQMLAAITNESEIINIQTFFLFIGINFTSDLKYLIWNLIDHNNLHKKRLDYRG